MNSESRDSISLIDEETGFGVLQDIEEQTSDEAREKRSHERIAVKAKIILQPGNSSEFLSFKVQGITGNISEGGCQAMFPVPLQVGDIYRLHFDRDMLDLPMIFVRCLRCRLVSDDAFAAGLAFFRLIKLPENLVVKK